MELNFTTVCFYLFAAITVIASLGVIATRKPVQGALSLVLAFFSAGMIWLLLQAEFLALALVLIYIGAVMVLFLFVVMMLDLRQDRIREGFWRYLPLGLVVALIMVGEMALVLGGPYFDADTVPPPEAIAADFSNTQVLAKLLFTDYAYPFELASLILLVAMIAAVALTLRHRSGTRRQNARRQIAVRASDRLVVHAMPAEVEEGERLSGDKTE